MNHLLNHEQELAVSHFYGPALVVAGAGSGKTKVAACRILKLIDAGVDPSKILGITFTNKAVKELKERIQSINHNIYFKNVFTFHKLGLNILKSLNAISHSARPIDEEEKKSLIKKILKEESIDKSHLNKICDFVTRVKSDIETIRDSSFDYLNKQYIINYERFISFFLEEQECFNQQSINVYCKVCNIYCARCGELNYLDFDDLIAWPIGLLYKNPNFKKLINDRWDFIIVDEYQDTGSLEEELLDLILNKDKQNIMVVGDPNQSIYAWRGAQVNHILNFERKYNNVKKIVLNRNYRSSKQILGFANNIICSSGYNLVSNFDGKKPELLSFHHEKNEVAKIVDLIKEKLEDSDESIAILYRTRLQSRLLESYLIRNYIQYSIFGGISFYEREEIKAFMAYVKFIYNTKDINAFERLISVPARGIGSVTIDRIIKYANERCNGCLLIAIKDQNIKEHAKLNEKQKSEIQNLVLLLDNVANATIKNDIPSLLEIISDDSGIREHFLAYENGSERISNINFVRELFSNNSKFNFSFSDFIEMSVLNEDIDMGIQNDKRVILTTIHSSKGLEFDNVILYGIEDGLLPHNNSISRLEREEEKRLFYVAATRAKNNLIMTNSKFRCVNGKLISNKLSEFIDDIPESCYIHRNYFNYERTNFKYI